MARGDRRAARNIQNLEARIGSIASRHVRPEHVDGALRSVARHLSAHLTPEQLEKLDPSELTNDLIDAHIRFHAGNHPSRVAPPVAPLAPAPLDSGIRRNPTEQLAHRQDAIAAARSGITKE